MKLEKEYLTLNDINKIRNNTFKEISKEVYGDNPNYLAMNRKERQDKHFLYQQKIRRAKKIPMFIKLKQEDIIKLIKR